MNNIVTKTPNGATASKVILENYIKQNFVSTEQVFALLVLQHSHKPNEIVENIDKFKPYKEFVEMKLNELFVEKYGFNLPSNLDCTRFFKKGKMNEDTKNNIMKKLFSANINDTSVILGDKLKDIINPENTCEIVDHTFLQFKSEKYGELGTIYRRLLKVNAVDGNNYLVVNDTKMYTKSTKIISHFSLIINGKPECMQYLGRLDSIGFMEEEFLIKNNIIYKLPDDVKREAKKQYQHLNYFNKNANHINNIESVDSNIHFHVLDQDFEFMHAIMKVYESMLPEDVYSKGKESLTKLNAIPYDHYHKNNEDFQENFHNEQLKIADAQKLNGIIPFNQILKDLNETLNILNAHEFDLGKYTFEFIDRCRDPNSQNLMTINSLISAQNASKALDRFLK